MKTAFQRITCLTEARSAKNFNPHFRNHKTLSRKIERQKE